MAGSNKQLYRTVQNKIELKNGIVRRPVESAQGYVSALFNYEMKDGTLSVRPGTRVMNNLENQQFYCIDSFRMCNMDVVIGLNYKRELWAWLEKWPETDFKVYNTSPFVSYPHKSDAGNSYESRHFAFSRGNKFFMNEDDYSIIVSNDYGDIYRIMKVGSIRITEDSDANTYQTEDIDNARVLELDRARLYVDIKDATNKIFSKEMYFGEDPIKNSHRITGETRFAYVNELGVISELSDPINIEGYRHIVASSFRSAPYDKANGVFPFSRIVQPGTIAITGHSIYENTSSGIAVGATEGNPWQPSDPAGVTSTEVRGVIIAVKEAGQYADGATIYSIPEGVYMCVQDATGQINMNDTEFNYNFVKISAIDICSTYVKKGGSVNFVQVVQKDKTYNADDFDALPNVRPLEINATYVIKPDDMSSVGAEFTSGSEIDFGVSGIKWVRLKDSYDGLENGERDILIKESLPGTQEISFTGAIYEVDFSLRKSATDLVWEEADVFGVEISTSLFGNPFTMWKNIGYDCWEYLGSITNPQSVVDSFDLDKNGLVITGIDAETDVILSGSVIDIIYGELQDETARFAVWNDSYVMGVSQRCFIDRSINGIIYKGSQQSETGNLNTPAGNVPFYIGYSPLMTLDYTGMRRIPMPLTQTRRAMRNPQSVVVAGGNVYSIEDNKIWVGEATEFMMTDFVNLNTAIYDIAEFGSGVIASTKDGLYLVEKGSDPRSVVDGEGIIPRFIAKCAGGVITVNDNGIYIVYRHFTQSGSWYPAAAKISDAISEVNLEGELKSVSIGDIIYLADENMVWLYDIKKKIWCGQYNYGEYGEQIQSLFVFKNKLGVVFMTGVDREKSFDAPDPIPDQ